MALHLIARADDKHIIRRERPARKINRLFNLLKLRQEYAEQQGLNESFASLLAQSNGVGAVGNNNPVMQLTATFSNEKLENSITSMNLRTQIIFHVVDSAIKIVQLRQTSHFFKNLDQNYFAGRVMADMEEKRAIANQKALLILEKIIRRAAPKIYKIKFINELNRVAVERSIALQRMQYASNESGVNKGANNGDGGLNI